MGILISRFLVGNSQRRARKGAPLAIDLTVEVSEKSCRSNPEFIAKAFLSLNYLVPINNNT